MRSIEHAEGVTAVAVGPQPSSGALAAFERCAACGRVVLGRADGGGGVVGRERSVSPGVRGMRTRWRRLAFHASCFESRVEWQRRRARGLLSWTVGAALAGAMSLWVTGQGMPAGALAAALLAALGAYAALGETTDIVAGHE